MKEKEVIKTFLEWYNKSEWKEDSYRAFWINVSKNKLITTDQLIDLYEHETKQYTAWEVWCSVGRNDDAIEDHVAAFAERYHELKTQNRIK